MEIKMKKIRNLGNYAVCAAVTVLTACAANPVEDVTPNTTVKSSEKIIAVVKTKAKAPVIKKAKVVISAKQAQNKKKQIIAMGKAKAKVVAVQKPKPVWKKPVVKKVAVVKPKIVVRKKAPVVIARAPQVRPIKRVVTKVKVAPKVVQRVVQKTRPIVKPQQRVYKKATAKPQLQYAVNKRRTTQYRKAVIRKPATVKRHVTRIDPDQSFGYALSNAAINRTKHRVRYDGAYIKIGYPWGDVPKSIGVCTDVVIRAYRKLGIDLQQEVHKDISKDFYAYPNLVKWGLTKPDPNIDHRRVYNLQAFFKRHKAELPRSRNPRDYKPGDLVTWMVGPSFPHIGVVVNKPSKADPNRLMISHNIGAGPMIEDILFRFPMTGHYRYTPRNKKINPALHFAKTPVPASVQRKNAMNYNDLLEASRHLLGDTKKVKAPNKNVIQARQTQPTRINLAQLDPAALNALLKY